MITIRAVDLPATVEKEVPLLQERESSRQDPDHVAEDLTVKSKVLSWLIKEVPEEMLGLKDVLPKDLRNNRHDLRMNIVKEEMDLVGVREADLWNVVRWR